MFWKQIGQIQSHLSSPRFTGQCQKSFGSFKKQICNKQQNIYNTYNPNNCRGRLVQWKNVRFVKIFFALRRGPWFETRRGLIFSGASSSRNMFDGNFWHTDMWITQPRFSEENAVAINSTIRKRNVALNKLVHILLRYSTITTTLATWGGILRV